MMFFFKETILLASFPHLTAFSRVPVFAPYRGVAVDRWRLRGILPSELWLQRRWRWFLVVPQEGARLGQTSWKRRNGRKSRWIVWQTHGHEKSARMGQKKRKMKVTFIFNPSTSYSGRVPWSVGWPVGLLVNHAFVTYTLCDQSRVPDVFCHFWYTS